MGLKILGKVFIVLVLLQSYQVSPLEGYQNNKHTTVKIIPKSYTLNIQPYPNEETFVGEVVISVAFLETTNVITLNAHKNLIIADTEVVLAKPNSDGLKEATVKIEKIRKPDETNTFSIILEKAMNTGAECAVKIKFSGLLNTHTTKGFFKKTYVDFPTGQSTWIIASNFQPNFASTAFPCFDDPSFKVPFDVSIQRPSKLNSMSTMPLLQSVDMGTGWVKDVYASTPPIATFSLAIFVSDLTPLIYNKPDVQIRIWSAPELSKNINENRSEIIISSIKMFEEYFGTKYPLPKLDYIALPNSANTTVFNNWGLIISSNHYLGDDSTTEKWQISFEISNQWIGNLITPFSWEEDISVTALAYFSSGINSIKNFGRSSEGWPLRSLYATYYQLGSPNTSDREEITRMTLISLTQMVYRMLTYTLTEQTFSTALKNFIKNKQYKTFHIDDFWDALTKQAHTDGNLPADMTTKEVAMSWIKNYRLPFLTVTRNYNANSALLTQRLFIRTQPRSIVKDKDLLWTMPIVVITQNKLNFANTKPIYWMKNRYLNVENVADKNEFIIINSEEIAPYMVNYDKTNWNMLADFLQSNDQRTKIPVITRAKLIHDALNLAYSGALDFGTALNMTVYLKDETDPIVWKPFFLMFDHIGRHIDGSKALKKYQTYVSILTKHLYDRLMANAKNPNQETCMFINEVEHVLRRVGNDQLVKESNTAYEKWMRNPSKDYKLVSKHLCTIFRYGTKEQWEFGLKTLLNLKDKPEIERGYLFKTLVGCATDYWKIQKFLNMTIFEQNDAFTDGDITYALSMLTGGADGYMATFEYLTDNWKILKTRLQNKPDIWKQLIYTATGLYKTQDGLNQVSEFYSKHRGQFGDAETTIQDSLRNIKEEAQWTDENMVTLEEWLDDYILKNSPQN